MKSMIRQIILFCFVFVSGVTTYVYAFVHGYNHNEWILPGISFGAWLLMFKISQGDFYSRRKSMEGFLCEDIMPMLGILSFVWKVTVLQVLTLLGLLRFGNAKWVAQCFFALLMWQVLKVFFAFFSKVNNSTSGDGLLKSFLSYVWFREVEASGNLGYLYGYEVSSTKAYAKGMSLFVLITLENGRVVWERYFEYRIKSAKSIVIDANDCGGFTTTISG